MKQPLSPQIKFISDKKKNNNHLLNTLLPLVLGTQQTKTSKVNTESCILLNIVAIIYRFESFHWTPIQILYIHGHFKLANMKLQVLMIKLTHWAWAACGSGSNAKWPDKICECVLNYKMETRTIECVAFFYHEGAKRDDFIQKNKFRCCVDSSQWGSVVKLREHVR